MRNKGLNVLSLFDGMGCGWIALKELGIKVNHGYASEVDKFAIAQTTYNFPDIVHLGSVTEVDVSKLEPIDLLIGGSPCFAAGTMVLTDKGYKPIESIEVGDMVLTHMNRYRKVLAVGGKISERVLLKAQGILPTITTNNHPYFIRRGEKKYIKSSKTSGIVCGEPDWVEVKDLRKRDFVGIPINKESVNSLNLNPDEAYILGRYIADGCIHNGQIKLAIGRSKIDTFKMPSKCRVYEHEKNCFVVYINDKRLTDIAINHCGSGAANKQFSNEILSLPKDLLECVIEGYLSGDGCVGVKGQMEARTISKKLALTFAMAVHKVYRVHCNIHHYKTDKRRTINGIECNQSDIYGIDFRKTPSTKTRAKVIDGYVWTCFRSVEKKDVGMVYNIEVEEDNSYVANGAIVHNCQNFSFAGKRQGMVTTEKEEVLTLDRYLQLKQEGFKFEGQSYLFWEYMRILNDIRKYNPNVLFLLENVEIGKKWESVFNEAIGLKGVHINAALVSAQNRRRIYWTNIRVGEEKQGGVKFSDIPQPEDRGILLKDILEDIVDEKYYLSDKMVDCLLNRKKTETYSPCKFKPIEKPYEQKSRTINHRVQKMGDADNYIAKNDDEK